MYMKKMLLSLAMLLAASGVAFADDTDPNPQERPSSSAGNLETSCGQTVYNVPAPECFESLTKAMEVYADLAKAHCGDGATYTWNRS